MKACNFLALLILRISLSIELAHLGIINEKDTNDDFLSLAADIDTYKHSSTIDLWAEAHALQVNSELGIDDG